MGDSIPVTRETRFRLMEPNRAWNLSHLIKFLCVIVVVLFGDWTGSGAWFLSSATPVMSSLKLYRWSSMGITTGGYLVRRPLVDDNPLPTAMAQLGVVLDQLWSTFEFV